MNITGIYTNREEQQWRLTDMKQVPFSPGFWHGTREDGKLVQVHEHRLVFEAVETKEEKTT